MEPSTERSLSKWLFRAIVLAIGISPPAVILLAQNTLAQALNGTPTIRIVQVGAVLLLIATALSAYIIFQHPWLRWDEPTGTWVHRVTGIRYCGTCRAKKIIVPLKNEITGWRCVSCQHFRTDPARNQKEEPINSSPKHERI